MKTKRRIIELYAKHCDRPIEDVERTLDRDYFMSAEEAKNWGIVDHVYETRLEREPLRQTKMHVALECCGMRAREQ